MIISDESFNSIYENVNSKITSDLTPNKTKARAFISECHLNFALKQGITQASDSTIFYLANESDKTREIDLILAPSFENRVDFIQWAKNEIKQVIENLN